MTTSGTNAVTVCTRCVAALVLSVLVAITNATAATTVDELKAVYIARFTEFIEWPALARSPNGTLSPFRICVFGAHPIEAPLAKLPALVKVQDATVEVVRVVEINDAAHCAILFIPTAAVGRLPALLREIGTKPVLTIGESADMIEHGTLMNFFIDNERLRFAVDLPATRAVGLTLSARLLKLAKVK